MIQNIFIPEIINGKRLFNSRVIGLLQEGNELIAARLFISRNGFVLEKIDHLTPESSNDLTKKIETGDALLISAPSEKVVLFKELKFPFNKLESIQLALGYELEQFLPFNKNDAIFDCCLTQINKENTTVMSATMQKNSIFTHLASLSEVNLNPYIVTIESFSSAMLYGKLYTNQFTIIITAELDEIKLICLDQGTLYAVRIISQGFKNSLETLAKHYNRSFHELILAIREHTITQEQADFQEQFKNASKAIIHTIKLTIESITTQEQAIPEIVITGLVADIMPSIISSIFEEYLHKQCSILPIQKLLEANHIKHTINVSHHELRAVMIGMSQVMLPYLSMRKDEFAPKNTMLLIKQLSVGLILLLMLLGSMLWHYKHQINRLHREINTSKSEVVDILREQFTIPKEEEDLQDILDLAEQKITQEQETWFAFSYANQSRFLQYLLELTNKIDKKSLGFIAEKITIIEGSLVLKARVKDYDALKILEKELRSSPLFSSIEPQDNPQFTMKITLAPTNRELL